jgi:hypothetical protein
MKIYIIKHKKDILGVTNNKNICKLFIHLYNLHILYKDIHVKVKKNNEYQYLIYQQDKLIIEEYHGILITELDKYILEDMNPYIFQDINILESLLKNNVPMNEFTEYNLLHYDSIKYSLYNYIKSHYNNLNSLFNIRELYNEYMNISGES